jgi:hypothetical protein
MNRSALALAENPAPMEILSAEERLQRAIMQADTLGNVSGQIDKELAMLQSEVEQGIVDASDGTASDIRQVLTTRQNVIAPLAAEYGSVQVASLAPNIGGMAPVGGNVSEILVSADQVAHGDAKKLEGILVHEVQHTDQTQLKTAGGAVLIVDGKEVRDDTVLLEGDTEITAKRVVGDRDDRPQKVYGEGLEIAESIDAYAADTWQQTLTGDGNVEALQNAVWINGVEQGSLSAEDVVKQAEQTGYMFNDAFIAAQNDLWASAIQSGRIDAQEVQEVAQQLGIELSSEVNLAIAKVAAETRKMYLDGPKVMAA